MRLIDADVLSHKLKTAIDIGKRCEMDTLELEGVLNCVEAMPTVNTVPQWIPCSERLPDAGKIVLVCGKMGGIYTAIYSKQRANWDNGWWKLNSKTHRCDPEAWMPLPERYRGNKNDSVDQH